MPKGTRILAIAHYDNSPNNKYNPDPTKPVWWGDQNWDEMQSGFLGLIFDAHTDGSQGIQAVRAESAAAGNVRADTGCVHAATGALKSNRKIRAPARKIAM